ncbi:MAG: homoserine dehydrogenase [Armatimonadetes bacterium]|nr:homoserine dehydrogenase [Armatimonadota bacterium]
MAVETKSKVVVGIVGCGVVGNGAVRLLVENARWIAQRVGAPVVLKSVADIDWERPREFPVPPELRQTDAETVLADPEVQIVVEAIGGTGAARRVVEMALSRGKSVVTPNKELIAKHGRDLLASAAQKGVDLMFEGAVGGGIPLIKPMKESLAGDSIQRIVGIVNGTTNYILTGMARENRDFGEALAAAQQLGYAEADPTADVEGFDSLYKIAILAAIAFGSWISVDQVYHEGITRVTAADIRYARQLGFAVKLLAIAAHRDGALDMRVHPAFVPLDHPLASVGGVYNAVMVRGALVQDVMFYGRGAGAGPTGTAVVGDVLDCARNLLKGAAGRVPCRCFRQLPVLPIEQVVCRNYVRMQVTDRPGVIGKIATCFGNRGVSLASVFQPDAEVGDHLAEVVWITHEVPEERMRAALADIRGLPEVAAVPAVIRLEQGEREQ